MDVEKEVAEDMVEDVQEDKVEDTEEGLVENLEEVLEEFGQSPQKQCPKPIGPFQGHPLNQKEILSYSNQLALSGPPHNSVDLEKELTEDMVDDVEEDKVEDMEEGQVLGGVW